MTHDVIVLGAGAAGMMAAGVAGQRGRRVLLADHNDACGKKILISGGGRCNFTNTGTVPERYLSANPHFAKSALGRYTAADFVALVDRHGIAWHEKTLGQLFCDGSAKQIVAMLAEECAIGDVETWLSAADVAVEHRDARWHVSFADGRQADAPALVLATGGPAIPKLGATGFAYTLAKRFGLKLVEPRPALVPLTLGGDEALFGSLAGVAAPVEVRSGGAAFREAALFTHRGLSGPAILQASSYWRPGEAIAVDFLPDAAPGWLRAAKRAAPRSTLERQLSALPGRLAGTLAEHVGVTGALADAKDAVLERAETRLAAWPFRPNGTEGFAKAEVTVGGIDTRGLSSRTMEARGVPGLYAVGEAVDVTGWLGGYNFQWAWASGWAAGQAV